MLPATATNVFMGPLRDQYPVELSFGGMSAAQKRTQHSSESACFPRAEQPYLGISPASSLSITLVNEPSGCAPMMARPLTKKVGVELMPRLLAKSLSAWMVCAYLWLVRQ